MENTATIICSQLIRETLRRICEEGIPRIHTCLDQLTIEEVWFRPNQHSNSVGNLVLHLCGNVRQWAIATLGSLPDLRQRQKEFDERGPLPRRYLDEQLIALENDLREVLAGLDPAQISREYEVQGFRETGTAILMHVAEHFSYHVGQITYFVKMRKDMDMGYYSGLDLG